METTDENKSGKGNKAKKTPNVPVHSPIPFPTITENKNANTVNKQDKATKQAAGANGNSRDQLETVAVSKNPRIDAPLHSALKLTTGQTSGNKPESPKIVEENVSDIEN